MLTVARIKEFRAKLHSLAMATKRLMPSREVSLAVTNLQLAKMWMGLLLGAAGEGTPYPESDDPKSKRIEAEADRGYEFVYEEAAPDDAVAQVKELRKVIKELVDELRGLQYHVAEYLNEPDPADDNAYWGMEYFLQVCLVAMQARLWLGMELGQLREKVEAEGQTSEVGGQKSE